MRLVIITKSPPDNCPAGPDPDVDPSVPRVSTAQSRAPEAAPRRTIVRLAELVPLAPARYRLELLSIHTKRWPPVSKVLKGKDTPHCSVPAELNSATALISPSEVPDQ